MYYFRKGFYTINLPLDEILSTTRCTSANGAGKSSLALSTSDDTLYSDSEVQGYSESDEELSYLSTTTNVVHHALVSFLECL